jgi:hypothetical protein
MAQTKRRRRSKHRGNAAGTVEARGRTGRKPTGAESRKASKPTAAQRRLGRMDQPPTWRGAVVRAALAAGVFLLLVLVLFREPVGVAIPLAVFTLAIYIPIGYYVDLAIYRRRQRRQALQATARKESR